MKTLVLHGQLAQFGPSIDLDIQTFAEGIRAVALQMPGFEEILREGNWHIVRGPLETRDDVSEEALHMEIGSVSEFHILPAIAGGGGGGTMSIIVGVALIATAIFVPMAATLAFGLAGAGVGMAVGGIVANTMKVPSADTNTESVDDRASFLFNGPKNQSSQGVAIPRGYGRVRSGSIVVSSALYAEDLTDE